MQNGLRLSVYVEDVRINVTEKEKIECLLDCKNLKNKVFFLERTSYNIQGAF